MAPPSPSPPSPPPNTASDTQWFHSLGYSGILDFMHDYGFTDDEQDHFDALILLRQFRNEQQEAWEKSHSHKLHPGNENSGSVVKTHFSFTMGISHVSRNENESSTSNQGSRKESCHVEEVKRSRGERSSGSRK